jgi:hypothetical protein
MVVLKTHVFGIDTLYLALGMVMIVRLTHRGKTAVGLEFARLLQASKNDCLRNSLRGVYIVPDTASTKALISCGPNSRTWSRDLSEEKFSEKKEKTVHPLSVAALPPRHLGDYSGQIRR